MKCQNSIQRLLLFWHMDNDYMTVEVLPNKKVPLCIFEFSSKIVVMAVTNMIVEWLALTSATKEGSFAELRCFARFGTILCNISWKTLMEECLFKLQALTCNFTKSNTFPWVFFTFLKLFVLFSSVKMEFIYLALIWCLVKSLSANPTNSQTHSNSSSANCRRIVWVGLTILWD